MSKIKVLIYIVIVLVILNVSMICFFLVTKSHHREDMQDNPKRIVIEKLHLNVSQQEQYGNLIAIHRKKIENLEQNIRKNKELLYHQLSKSELNISTKDSLITVLGNLQKGIETVHFEHFQELKKICNTPEQQNDYKLLTAELGKLFSGRNKRLPLGRK